MELREGDSANGSEIQFQRIEGESDGEQEDVQKKGGGGERGRLSQGELMETSSGLRGKGKSTKW